MKASHILTRPLYRLYEERLMRSLDPSRMPRHVGVINDGHRRYVRETGLPDYAAGYRVGLAKFLDFLGWSAAVDVPAITCWLLSKENLARSPVELEPYFEQLEELFRGPLIDAADSLDFEVRFIGSLDLLPASLDTAAKELEELTAGRRRRLTIALAYGGRQEIVDAVRDLVTGLAGDGADPSHIVDAIDADSIARHLYTAELPDPDLVVRTSGESRLSGFLLWQSAYAEFAFVDVFWPAFRRVDFLRVLRDFSRRERRFGK